MRLTVVNYFSFVALEITLIVASQQKRIQQICCEARDSLVLAIAVSLRVP